VREWMTSDPRVVRTDTPAEEAALIMVEQGCHHLPVVDEHERRVGLVGASLERSSAARCSIDQAARTRRREREPMLSAASRDSISEAAVGRA
jgi:CBS domain-containing protein